MPLLTADISGILCARTTSPLDLIWTFMHFSVHLSHSGLFFLDSLLRTCQSATDTTQQSAPGQVKTSSRWAFLVSVADLEAPEQHRAVLPQFPSTEQEKEADAASAEQYRWAAWRDRGFNVCEHAWLSQAVFLLFFLT